jgi:four helix bundle protein
VSRRHEKLKVFVLADELTLEVYRATRDFPVVERFGLQAQLRRAAVSVPTNIVEGAVRASDKAFANYLITALGSASEVRYLLGLARRLELSDSSKLESRYDELVRGLQALLDTLQT